MISSDPLLDAVIHQLQEKKKNEDKTSGRHVWKTIEDEAKKNELGEEMIDLTREDKKKPYNPWGSNRKIAGHKERKANMSVDDTWPKGQGPKEYLKKIGMTEAKILSILKESGALKPSKP